MYVFGGADSRQVLNTYRVLLSFSVPPVCGVLVCVRSVFYFCSGVRYTDGKVERGDANAVPDVQKRSGERGRCDLYCGRHERQRICAVRLPLHSLRRRGATHEIDPIKVNL
jgi:hypothetical protein